MSLLLRMSKDKVNFKSEPDIQKIQESNEKCQFYLDAMRVLLLFLKDFSLDLNDLDSDTYKKGIDNLSAKLLSSDKTKDIIRLFDKKKTAIPEFIKRQKDYLSIREKEFRDIIELLSRAVAKINSENQEFNQRIHEGSEKMEAITRLEDIQKIKQELKQEIEQLKDVVNKKQSLDENHVKKLSSQVSSLENELEKVRTEALKDGLTGIYNRKAFDDYIEDLLVRSGLLHSQFAVILIDIDDFKAVNDTHGHIVGDHLLKAFASRCEEFTRREDFIARYGGEEFVIVLSGISLRNAVKKAKDICKTIANTRYLIGKKEAGKHFSVTVSIGVSIFIEGDTSVSIVDRADKALYQAKHLGKNQVVTIKK